MTHVIHLVIALDHGGLERQVLSWAGARHRQHPGMTRILCLDKPGHLADEADGVPVVCIHANRSQFPWDRNAVKRIRDEIRVREKDGQGVCIHSHNLAAWQYAVLACRGTRAGVLHTQHGANLHDVNWLNAVRIRWLSSRTEKLVTVSDETALSMCSHFGISRSTITVIPNGIDLDAYDSETVKVDGMLLRRTLNIPESAFVMGTVGRLADIKGPDRLLRAFADMMKTATDDVHLVFVGDGPMRGELEGLVLSLGLDAARVHFVGFRPDARPYYAMLDLFVLPSRSEGLSLALLEALSMCVPVVATDVGANAFVLADGSGLIMGVDRDWPEMLWSELRRLGQAANGQRARNSKGRQRVKDGFSLSASLAKYEACYKQFT